MNRSQPNTMSWAIWAVFLAVWPAPPALAQDDQEGGPAAEYESEVRAPRQIEPLDDAFGFAVTIDAEESTSEVRTVAELLERSPGVRTRSLGGLDSFATVSIRGASSTQVLVLLDGVPLGSALLQAVDINAIPPDVLERIEVYRSGAPIWLGSAPMGGAVNLVTRDASEPLLVASASFGSFLTRKATLTAATPLLSTPSWDLLIGGSYFGTEGDFTFRDDRGTPFNPDDDAEVARRNNDSNGGDLLVRTRLEPATNVQLTLQESLQLDRRGVSGLGQNQSDTASFEHLRSVTSGLTRAGAWPDDSTDTQVRLYVDRLVDRFSDRGGDIGVGQRDVDTEGLATGGQLRLNWFAAPVLELNGVLDGRWERFETTDRLAAAEIASGGDRWAVAPALSMALHLVDDRLALTAGGRWEHLQSDPQGQRSGDLDPSSSGRRTDQLWTAQLGVRFHGDLEQVRLTARGTAQRSARAPSLIEMFGDSGVIIGNDALVPESVLGGDVGGAIDWRGDAVETGLAAAFFGYQYSDLIQFVQNSQRVARPENIAEARILGLELEASLAAARVFDWYAAYTLTDSSDQSDVAGQQGNALPGRPRHALHTSATGHWQGFALTYTLDLETENAVDRANFRIVPDRILHGAALRYRPPFLSDWTLTLQVDNLLDQRVDDVPLRPQPPGVELTTEQAISDFLGFPLPGRSVFATLQWSPSLSP